MTVTMEYALWTDLESGAKPKLIKAAHYSKERDGGILTCAHPRCTAELYHVAAHSITGGGEKSGKSRNVMMRKISAHFARKAGEIHNRDAGCDYPNSEDAGSVKRANRLMAFFGAKGRKYIYLNSGLEGGQFNLPNAYKAFFRTTKHYGSTVKQSPLDATYSVKTAKDWRKLEQHTPFEDAFYNNVDVIANGYRVPFREFMMLSYKQLFNTAFHDAVHHNSRALVTEVVPLVHKSGTNEESGTYFVPCAPQRVPGRHSGFEYKVQPILATRRPELFKDFADSVRYRIWATRALVDPDVRGRLQSIREGSAPDSLPVTLWVNTENQIAELRST